MNDTSEYSRNDGATVEPLDTAASSSVTARQNASRDSIPTLIRQLADDVSTLMSKEISLAKAELREAARHAKAGAVGLVAGYGLVFSGFLVLLLAAVYALANVVAPWLAAVIVGLVTIVIGFIMAKAGQKKIEPDAFIPERTIDSVRKDKDLTKRAVS